MEDRFTDGVTDYIKADGIFEAWYGKANPKTVENLAARALSEKWSLA